MASLFRGFVLESPKNMLVVECCWPLVSSGVLLAATVGVRHEAVPRSSRMRLSVSIEAEHTLPSIRLSMTAYLRHATVGP